MKAFKQILQDTVNKHYALLTPNELQMMKVAEEAHLMWCQDIQLNNSNNSHNRHNLLIAKHYGCIDDEGIYKISHKKLNAMLDDAYSEFVWIPITKETVIPKVALFVTWEDHTVSKISGERLIKLLNKNGFIKPIAFIVFPKPYKP